MKIKEASIKLAYVSFLYHFLQMLLIFWIEVLKFSGLKILIKLKCKHVFLLQE